MREFIKNPLVVAAISVGSAAVTAAGLILDGRDIIALGLPGYLWAAIGAAIFMISLMFALYRQNKTINEIYERGSEITEQLADEAELNIRIFPDNRFPERERADNIWRWYYIQNVAVCVKDGKDPENIAINTQLFISFDIPVRVTTLELSSHDIKLPRYEVKEFNSRFAIIIFSGKLPPGVLKIKVVK